MLKNSTIRRRPQSNVYVWFEESYGYLVKPFVRDKDAIQALVLLAEVAAFYKNKEKHYTMAYKISLKNLVTLKKNYFRNNERN